MEKTITFPKSFEEAYSVKNLHWKYGEEEVFHRMNFSLKKGKFYSIVGPNGSGKTTLMKCMAKFLPVTKKKVYIEKEDLSNLSYKRMARKVASVPQSTEIQHSFSVLDVVLMGRSPYLKRFQWEGKEDVEIAERAMEATKIAHLREKSVQEISGGERQRVFIARALTQETDILFLDEPVSNIDLHHQVGLLDTLLRLNREKEITVVTILHDLNLAAEYSDEILLLEKGKSLIKGPVHKVMTKENIERVYEMKVKMITNPSTGKPYIIPEYHQFR